ncbi:MAG: hypothetical protein ABR879_06730 [Methanomassiliicoccales archaeon]|jgi:hypothetical protein
MDDRRLGAEGPNAELKEKLMLFGQFVGDWDIVKAWYRRADGTVVWQDGEVHFGWILGGRAVQDVWMTHRGDPPRPVPVGTTVRFFDPKTETWSSTWISPSQGLVQRFVGRHVGDDIVLETMNTEGFPERWMFSDITNDSFRWHSDEMHDGGKSWIQTEEMHIRRRA